MFIRFFDFSIIIIYIHLHLTNILVCQFSFFEINQDKTFKKTMIEYQVVFQKIRQFFLKHPVKPVNGFIYPSTIPGLGLELEESKIDSERDIF